jgi:hypothetical protein
VGGVSEGGRGMREKQASDRRRRRKNNDEKLYITKTNVLFNIH